MLLIAKNALTEGVSVMAPSLPRGLGRVAQPPKRARSKSLACCGLALPLLAFMI